LPPTPYDACEKKADRVSSLSLVRYRGTDYSVPTAYGHREVLIRGYVDAAVISCGAEVIARHPRSFAGLRGWGCGSRRHRPALLRSTRSRSPSSAMSR
jgi:hypothetical protein